MRGGGRGGERLFILLGYLFSVLPAALAAVTYFPVLHGRGESGQAVSLGAVILLSIALLPLIRTVRGFFRSPSAWKVWLAFFLVFYVTEAIASEMLAVSSIGLIGSLIGLVFFRLAYFARRWRGGDGGA